jgi:hypothetical protein
MAKKEKCEGGCIDPVVGYDCEGVPLCQGCIDMLKAECLKATMRMPKLTLVSTKGSNTEVKK